MLKKYKIYNLSILIISINLFSSPDLYPHSFFSGDNIKSACINYIHTVLNEEIDIKISEKIPNQIFEEEKVYARFFGEKNSLRGNTHIIIEFLKDEKLLKRITVPVSIKIFKKLPVAIRTINSGKEIKSGDFVIKKVDATYLNSEELLSEDEILGAIAKKNISRNNVILRSSIHLGNQINRGQKVELNVLSGAIRIRTTGVALQDGTVGSQIRVRKDDSNVIISGVVSQDGSVVINLTENK